MSDLLTATVDLPGAPVERFTLSYDPESEVQRGMHDDIVSGRTYEPGTWEAFKRILRPGDYYIDVGAHVGTFACLAASLVGPDGYVCAFEPDKTNRRALEANTQPFKWLEVDRCAVSDGVGRIPFHRCADNDGGHALYDPGLQSGNTKTRAKPHRSMVETIALDDIALADQLRLLKIDVEGAECSVLRGAQRFIAEHRPAIIAEINAIGLACMNSSENELRQLIRQHGYREYGVQDSAPWFIPLTPEQTCQPQYTKDGKTYLVVFNMLFVPNEWPEFG